MEKKFQTLTVEVEFSTSVSQERAWKGLVEETNDWWPKDFFTHTRTQKMVLEPVLGGRLFEDTGDGEGLIWASVVGVNSPRSILMKGNLSPEFGGPADTYLKIVIDDRDGKTTVNLTDTVFGFVDEGLKQSLTEGWELLIVKGLKAHLENEG